MKSTSDENSPSVYVKYLFASTLIYVLLPSLLFLGGWLKWYWAIPAVAIWITITARTIIAEFRGPAKDTPALGMNYLQIPIIAAYITYSSGVGSFVGQCANYVVWDNLKHPWPVVYPEKQAFYCYYVGYFLPIAALTKIASNLNLAEYFSFVWAWLGVTLCLF